MRKVLAMAFIVACGTAVAAEQEATSLSVGMAVDQQLSVVAELNEQYRFILGNEGVAFDYIIARGHFEEHQPLSWYVGAGGWAEWKNDFGMRVPLGLSYQISKGWDAYAQVQPELNLYKGPELQIGGALGIKYTF
ncbi:hypothetical protein [Vibrio sp. TRT 17S01]|uniref:hypothetical protein n=1 Tax=Vibrio sp. TRT 17S01 TaxID=3418505 RepID=UPI003CEB04CF